MKKRSIVNAYESVRPDEEARNRMLQNILLSSEITLTGKDERIMRKNRKTLMIAAIISLMILLMGSALIVWSLRDVKIGEIAAPMDVLDSEGNVKYEKGTLFDVISLHGFAGSPTYLAAQEWLEFEKNYDPDGIILAANDDYVAPEVYDAYVPYSQEMIDKIDEIAEKYGLNLLGPIAPVQRWEKKAFSECLGFQSLLVADTEATVTEMSGYFYEAGNFKVEFDMEMVDQENDWPYTMYNTIYYSRKNNFDDTYLNVGDIELWDHWTYTTNSGYEVRIASRDYGAIVFCDKEDSIIYVRIDNHYETDYNYDTQSFETNIVMTREQLEKAVDQIDFSIEVESVNMDLAKETLEWFRNR